MKVHRFVCFCLWLLGGVSGVYTDETETISVMEGDFVTLHTGFSEIQRDEQILWTFRPQTSETRIAEIYKRIISIYNSGDNESFRDRLQIDEETGSLTITNINTFHSGLYKVQAISERVKHKSFNIAVYGILTDPVIIRDCSSSSSSNCSLVCSVLNVSHVTLSWYKGMSVLSSISASNLSISLSLPLDVEYQDNNTYSCVISNPITHQTTHLNITQLCQPCAETSQSQFPLLSLLLPLLLLLVVAGLVVFFFCRRRKYTQAKQDAETNEEEVDYTDATFIKHRPPDTEAGGRDQTVYSEVALR